MILTITLNPSIDRRYHIDGLESGQVYRTDDYQYTIGGKGLNVTKVIHTLDEEVIATGFLGGNSGSYIHGGLNHMGISHKFIEIHEETRSCLAIICNDGSQMEILERGPSISEEELNKFLDLYEELLEKVDILCASGSLPKGLPVEIYGTMIKMANEKGKRFLLDTSGEALRFGIEEKPYLIKPNKKELEDLTGLKLNSDDELIHAGKRLLNKGIKVVVVSMGEEGAIVVCTDGTYRIKAPNIKAINPVGSGDAMIAGFAVALRREYDFESILRLGVACGTANAMEYETGKVEKDNVEKIMRKIFIERLD